NLLPDLRPATLDCPASRHPPDAPHPALIRAPRPRPPPPPCVGCVDPALDRRPRRTARAAPLRLAPRPRATLAPARRAGPRPAGRARAARPRHLQRAIRLVL